MKKGLFLVAKFDFEKQQVSVTRDLLELEGKDSGIKSEWNKYKDKIFEKRSIQNVPKSLNDIIHAAVKQNLSPEEKVLLFRAEITDDGVVGYFYVIGSMIEIG